MHSGPVFQNTVVKEDWNVPLPVSGYLLLVKVEILPALNVNERLPE